MLKLKIVEESLEIKRAKNLENLKEESGSIYEVINALIKTLKINKKEVLKIQMEKRKTKGGFKKGIYLTKY